MEIKFFDNLTAKQLDLVKKHLEKRVNAKSEKSGLGIVYDISYWCDMNCLGCAVNALCYKNGGFIPHKKLETSTAEAINILDKIHDYVSSIPNLRFFLNIGGGEPFLRDDLLEIIQEAYSRFGRDCLGLDTNGTFVSKERLQQITPYISYLGISLDGLEEYHNWWRGSNKLGGIKNSFLKTIETIKTALEIPELSKILEVSSVVTMKNIDQIPALMRYINRLGINAYSVHRPIPVGRMVRHMDLLPKAEDFLKLLVSILEVNEELNMDVHIHHSIESIYATLLLEENTYLSKKLGAPDKRSSIGIDPKGNVFFDPWCMVPPWNQLAGGSLLNENVTLNSILEQEIMAISQEYCSPEIRCQGCPRKCSGGSRIAVAASYIRLDPALKFSDVTVSHILTGMTEIDPACPLAQQ